MITIPGAGPLRQYALVAAVGGTLVTADHPAELRAYLKLATLNGGDNVVRRLGRCEVVDRHAEMASGGDGREAA